MRVWAAVFLGAALAILGASAALGIALDGYCYDAYAEFGRRLARKAAWADCMRDPARAAGCAGEIVNDYPGLRVEICWAMNRR
jgi:hypothetical protein